MLKITRTLKIFLIFPSKLQCTVVGRAHANSNSGKRSETRAQTDISVACSAPRGVLKPQVFLLRTQPISPRRRRLAPVKQVRSIARRLPAMGDQEARGDEFEKKAEKKLSGWGLFGNKHEDAADLFDKAANSFKLAKNCERSFPPRLPTPLPYPYFSPDLSPFVAGARP